MKVTQILYGQVVRIGKVTGRDGGTIYGQNLSKACEARYGFLQAPRVLADYDLTKGVTFLHGYFENRVVIDRFQVFNDGLVVEAAADTDELDRFLDDVVQWVSAENAMQLIREPNTPSYYQSNLELESDGPLWEAFKEFEFLGQLFANFARMCHQITPDYSFSGISMANGAKGIYKFERREANPSLYFSVASLRTEHHKQFADALESFLITKTSGP